MEWVVVVLVLLVVIVLALTASNKRKLNEQTTIVKGLDSLSSARHAVEEDITALADARQALDAEIGGRPLDDAATAEYRRVLDAYDSATQAMGGVTHPADLHNVTAIIADGRHAVVCVRARLDGEPPPERRPPCFFDPRHGPSERDVAWAPDGGESRLVPACTFDAELAAAGSVPDVRKVLLGTSPVPYYEAGPAFAPFTAGYFGFASDLFAGTVMGMALGSWEAGGLEGDR